MIGYLEGTLLLRLEDRIILLVNQVGYEIVLPFFVMETINVKAKEDAIALHIYYYQTERQPKPVLIGFNTNAEKEFFQAFLSVEAIGPMKAVKALTLPLNDIALAIEGKDVATLKQLKGIGARTAHKIIATLEGRMGRFITEEQTQPQASANITQITHQVTEVMVNQLGYKLADAKKLIVEAIRLKPDIASPEALIDEIFRSQPSP